MSRYERRCATTGNVTLNNSRKDSNTLKYWYFIQLEQGRSGKERWLQFDIRSLARVAGVPLPQLVSLDELKMCTDGAADYEELLRRDLRRVADWCASIQAVERLTSLAPRGAIWFLDDGFSDSVAEQSNVF